MITESFVVYITVTKFLKKLDILKEKEFVAVHLSY